MGKESAQHGLPQQLATVEAQLAVTKAQLVQAIGQTEILSAQLSQALAQAQTLAAQVFERDARARQVAGLYAHALLQWGRGAQLAMLVEELAELQVATLHWLRGREDPAALAGELADVQIMLEQALQILPGHVVDQVMLIREDKLQRLAQRLGVLP